MVGFRQWYRDERGLSTVVVMAALIVTGFIGVSLMKLVTGDSLARALYTGSSSARSAARTGIIDAVSVIEQEGAGQDEVIALLQNWIDANTADDLDDSDVWLTGSNDNFESLTEQLKFRTKLVAFDTDNFNVTLKSQGVGSGDSKASMTTVYHLDGLELPEIRDVNKPTNAIHIEGNDNFEMDCSLYVDGNIYTGGQLKMYNRGFYVSGDFRMKENSDETRITHTSEVVGKSYFGGKLDLGGGSLVLRGPSGFEKKIREGSVKAYNSVFTNDTIGSATTIYDSTITFWNYASTESYVNANVTAPLLPRSKSSEIEILNELSMSQTDPKPVYFNYDLCNSYVHKVVGGGYNNLNITSDDLNDWYDYAVNNQTLLNDEFFVLKVLQPGYNNIFSTAGVNPFRGKMIVLIENEAGNDAPAHLTDMYESADNAISAIYIKKGSIYGGHMDGFRNFRGFVYVNSGGMVAKPLGDDLGSHIRGAVYHRAGAKHKYENNGGKQLLKITYDEDVIDRLADADVFTDPTETVSIIRQLRLKANYSKINTHLLSQVL